MFGYVFAAMLMGPMGPMFVLGGPWHQKENCQAFVNNLEQNPGPAMAWTEFCFEYPVDGETWRDEPVDAEPPTLEKLLDRMPGAAKRVSA